MKEHLDLEHILVVTELPEEPGFERELEYELEHPPTCPTEDSPYELAPGVPFASHTCMTGAWWDEMGREFLDLEAHPLEPGRYVVQGWHTPGGWAGADPIDPDGGIYLLGKEGEVHGGDAPPQ